MEVYSCLPNALIIVYSDGICMEFPTIVWMWVLRQLLSACMGESLYQKIMMLGSRWEEKWGFPYMGHMWSEYVPIERLPHSMRDHSRCWSLWWKKMGWLGLPLCYDSNKDVISIKQFKSCFFKRKVKCGSKCKWGDIMIMDIHMWMTWRVNVI